VTKENFAVLISGLSLAISIAGFIWSIFKEFIYVKPKLRVSFHSYLIYGDGGLLGRALGINVANSGPGHVVLNNCIVRIPSGWFKRDGCGMLPNPSDVALSHVPSRFPHKMEPGDVKAFYFPLAADGFMASAVSTVGVSDTYGRNHFASRSSMRRAREDWHKALRQMEQA
jgi:hypothetical protein